MKNKLSYMFLGLLVSFAFVDNVFAFDFTVTADIASTEVVKGTEATININLKSDTAIAGCLFKVESDSTIELVSKNGLNGWNISLEGTEGINLENSSLSNNSLTEGKAVLAFKYKVNGNGKVTIKTDHCVSTLTEEKNTFSDVVVDFTTKDVSQDTTLSSLSISGAEPIEFSPGHRDYAVKLNNPNFSLTMTASNPDYQDDIVVTDINGNVLDPSNITFSDASGQGLMVIKIVVNEDEEHAYELAAEYKQPNLDNSLSSLKINGETITLNSGEFKCSITVGSDVESINIEAVLKDSENFEFAEGNGPGWLTLGGAGSVTPFALIINPKSAESGGKSVTYELEIIKEGSSGGDNNPPSDKVQNPQTGGISMFIMAFVLISSLFGSIFLYQRNLESYK